ESALSSYRPPPGASPSSRTRAGAMLAHAPVSTGATICPTMTHPIYLDHHSTTPVDPRVLDAMLPFLREHFGNASNRSHAFGRTAAAAVEEARERVAQAIRSEERRVGEEGRCRVA